MRDSTKKQKEAKKKEAYTEMDFDRSSFGSDVNLSGSGSEERKLRDSVHNMRHLVVQPDSPQRRLK